MATNVLDTPLVTATTSSTTTTGNAPLPSLNPRLVPFVTSPAGQDAVPHSSRSSFTRVDHDDDQQREPRLPSHDPTTPPTMLPTPQHTANMGADDSEQPPPLISTLSQDKQLTTEADTPTQLKPTMGEPVPQTPQTHLTFLLISGKRRTMAFEPDTTIGRVKELAWNSWPADWQDDRPPAPSYLRVLYLGRMLQDDENLTNLRLPTHTQSSSAEPTPTIVHLSIRPYGALDDDAVKKKRRRGQDASGSDEPGNALDEAGCCRCIIC